LWRFSAPVFFIREKTSIYSGYMVRMCCREKLLQNAQQGIGAVFAYVTTKTDYMVVHFQWTDM